MKNISPSTAAKHVNEVHLIGQLAQNPFKKLTHSGKAMATASLCMAAGARTTTYVRIVAFEDCTELLGSQHRGDFVEVFGRINSRSWTEPNRAKRYITEVVVQEIFTQKQSDSRSSSAPPEGRRPDAGAVRRERSWNRFGDVTAALEKHSPFESSTPNRESEAA